MAEAAQHHEPSYKTDRELSKQKYGFLKTVDDNSVSSDSNKSASNNPAGRPPLTSYLEPEDTPEFAFTTQRIEENYPFFGTLMKRKNGLFKRKEVIRRDEAKDIEYVKNRYGSGGYQVRQKLEDGGEQKINFNVSGVEKTDSNPQPKQQAIDEEFISGLRRELKEEIRADYDDLVSRLEKRLASRNDELEELSRKVRSLNMELAEAERSAARSVREDHKEFEGKIEQLKEQKRDLEFEVFELKQELKYADAEGGFDLAGMLKDAASNPQLMNLLAPLLGKIFGGGQPTPPSPAALGSAEPLETQQQASQDASPRSNPGQDRNEKSEQQNETNNESEPTQQQKMQHLVNQFSTNVI